MGTKITPFNLHTSVDSHVKGLIDSDYVAARSAGGTDSASTQAMIDSNFANMNVDLHMQDNQKITFGDDSSSDFFIQHASGGSGQAQIDGTNIRILTNDFRVKDPANSEQYIIAQQNAGVTLLHDNSVKFATSTTGATVTGTINADSATFGGGITVTGGNTGDVLLTFATDRSWQFQQSGDDAQTQLQLKANTDSKIFSIANNNGDNDFFFFTSHTGTPYLYIGEDAQIRFEGATANDYETILTVTDPTADNTITLPDATGTVIIDTGDQNITGDLTITSTDADANSNPLLILERNSASPAVNDLLGQIQFKGEDAASSSVIYGQITGIITDPTDGSEDGLIRFESLAGGSLYTAYQIGYSGNFFYLDLYLQNNSKIHFEGSTDDNFETTVTATDPTADRTITLPDASGTVALTSDITVTASSTTTLTNKTLTSPTITDPTITGTMNATGAVLSGSSPLVFEGSGVDANETTLAVTNPTADRTITLPDMTGRVNEVLISSGSINASSLNFNSSVITSIYSELRLVIANAKPSTSAALYMRVGSGNSADTGTNYGQAIYYTGYYASATAYSVSNVDHDGTNFVLASGYATLGTGTGQNGHFEMILLNPNTSSHYKFVRVQTNLYSYYPMLMGGTYNSQVWKSTAAINYLQVYPSSGNLACDYKLYGTRS